MSDEQDVYSYSDVYDILAVCTNEEIAPIVDVLVASPLSVLKLCRAFERNTPDHALYADRIGDEIYRLGLAAMYRKDGRRPAYSVMVEALCKQIGLPVVAGNVGANEAILINAFATQHLSSVPTADRPRLVGEAGIAAADAARGILSSEAWPPFAPVLLHLAYLRRKLVEDGRMPSLPDGALTVLPVPTDERVDTQVVRLADGDPVLSLATIPGDSLGWQALAPGDKVTGLLYPILETIQPVIAASQVLRTDTFWKVAEKGTAHIVQGGHQGMRNLAPVSAAGLLGPIALMALASAMIEQHKLEQIEKGLAEIKAALQDVAKFQKYERRSILTGSIRYFQQVASSVLAGELAEEVLHGLERHEVELVRVQDHLAEEVHAQIATLRGLKKDSWGGGSKYAKAIEERLNALDKAYDELFLCIRARACAYMLLCAFPGRAAGKRARLDDIRSALDTFLPGGEATIMLDRGLREKVEAVSALPAKGALFARENALLDRLAAGGVAIRAGLEIGTRRAPDEKTPISFDVKLQNGRPIAVRMAEPAPISDAITMA